MFDIVKSSASSSVSVSLSLSHSFLDESKRDNMGNRRGQDDVGGVGAAHVDQPLSSQEYSDIEMEETDI